MNPQRRAEMRDEFLRRIRHECAIMAVLNATPDSFSDGGDYLALEAALVRAETMWAQGCDIIDVGGESTRPGAEAVSEAEELDRVGPIVAALAGSQLRPISIDTYKASVACLAVECGAIIVNDVWGLQKDPRMAEVVAENEVAVVINHNREEPNPRVDILGDIRDYFSRSLEIAENAGIKRDWLILDPGLGFGKTFEQNLTILAHFSELRNFGLPILVGLSRKSFIGRILDVPVNQRLIGTVAANLLCISQGVSIIRVHDVAEHKSALRIFNAVKAQQKF
jgi:dihydropteroate synthase